MLNYLNIKYFPRAEIKSEFYFYHLYPYLTGDNARVVFILVKVEPK